MKKTILFFSALLGFTTALAQPAELLQEVNVPVQSAIVYLYGAEVSHTKSVTLNQGRNRVVFTGLSPKLNSKSIQVSVGGNISILAISDAINYMAGQKESTRIRQLKDSVNILADAIAQQQNDKDAYSLEKSMILKNESIGGQDKGVPVAELKLAADFFRSRIKEINAEILKIDRRIETLNEAYSRASQQLAELNAQNNQPTAEISILLMSAAKTSTTIDLRYIVTDAGWAPSYDLRAEDVSQPVELKYRAKVFNNTGVDWTDIRLKLSTADPSQSAAKPILNAWNLNYVQNDNRMAYSQYYNNSNAVQSEGYIGNNLQTITMEDSFKPAPKQQVQKQPIQFEEIQVSELSAEFDIATAYSIPSDSKPYIVDVTEYKLPATYQHFSVPKLDRDAFLLARITGWEDLDLVEGPANVYYGGTYVGQSYIYTRSADDTLDLSLGRDNKVLVTRTKVKDFSSRKLLGNSTKETFSYEMVLKNNRKTAVQIEVEDQLPLSSQSDITVEPMEISKAEHDPKSGKLTWKYTLQPGEVKKITLSFSIKYPRNSQINIQQTKKKYRAKF